MDSKVIRTIAKIKLSYPLKMRLSIATGYRPQIKFSDGFVTITTIVLTGGKMFIPGEANMIEIRFTERNVGGRVYSGARFTLQEGPAIEIGEGEILSIIEIVEGPIRT